MIRRLRHSVLLAASVALSASCAAPVVQTPPDVVAPQTVQLTDDDVTALAELLRMEDSRVLDFELAARHLRSTTPGVRGRAALAAARTGDPNAAALARVALADPDPSVRSRAAFALGELADSSTATLEALSAQALAPAVEPAVEAVHALGKIGTAGARPAIDSILAHGRSQRVVEEALLSAWRLPRAASTHELLVRHTREDVDETRWRAAYALGRTGGPAAIAPLLVVVRDPDARVRTHALRGLRAPIADSAGMRERAFTTLLDAARDTHPHVRITAVNLLPAYRLPDRSAATLAAALNDPDDNVAVTAALALQQLIAPSAATALRTVVYSGRPDGLRAAALHALVRTDTLTGAQVATEWSDSTRWLLRMHAARALSHAPRDRAQALLQRLARDSHYLVASEALAALRLNADSIPDVRPLYVELLGARHPLVRAAALRGLARHVGPADYDLLLQAFETARRDTVRDAAVAAVNALARLRRSGVPVERSFFLRFASAPADPQLYRLITDSIGTPPPGWGEPAPAIRLGEPAFYEYAIRSYVVPVVAGAAPPRVSISTPHGDIVLELASADAPLTVHNFLTLVESGYYAGTRWHRVVPNFVIQDGDPRGDGSGGPGYAIRDEINSLRYGRGTLGMALSGPDTGGSQFFITHSAQPHLDGGYTVFGRVTSGMDVVDQVVQDEPILGFRVVR